MNGTAELGGLGSVQVSGAWSEIGWCVSPAQPLSPTVAGVQLDNVDVQACLSVLPDAAVAQVSLSGQATIRESTVAFTGEFTPTSWSSTIVVAPGASVTLGGLSLTDVVLTLVDDGLDGTSAQISATLILGDGATAITLDAAGEYVSTGEFTLALNLPDGTTWTPAPGLSFETVTGTLDVTDAAASASITIATTVDLGPFADVSVTGTLAASSDGLALTGCLTAPAFDATAGGYGFEDITLEVCFDSDEPTLSFPLEGTLVLGDPSDFDGVLTTGDDWGLALSLPSMTLGDFTVDDATLTLTHNSAAGTTAATVEGELSIGTGDGALDLAISGAYSESGDLSLAVNLPDGKTWSPVDGFVLSELSGTLTRTNGVWALSLTASTTANLGPLGSADVTGSLSVDPTAGSVTGCLSGSLSPKTVDGFPLSSLTFSTCFDKDAQGNVAVTYPVLGKVNIDGNPFDFSGVYIPSSIPDEWQLKLTVDDLSLDGQFVLDQATLVLTHTAAGTDVSLDALLTVGKGAGALQLSVKGEYVNTGDTALTVTLLPGQTWSPFAGLTFSDVTGQLKREGGVWSLGLNVDTTANLGPLGTADVNGTLNVEDNGQTVTGCLGGSLSGKSLQGLKLSALTFSACFDKDGQGNLLVSYPMAGQVEISGELLAFDGAYLPSSTNNDWTVELNVNDLVLDAQFTLSSATFSVAYQAGTTAVSLKAEMTVGQGDGGIALLVTGTWSNSGDVTLNITLAPGETWSPFPGLTFSSISGTLNRSGGVWGLNLTVTTDADLGPLGSAQVTGALDVQDNGKSVSGCLDGTLPDQTLEGFPLKGLTLSACFDKDDAGDLIITYPVFGEVDVSGSPFEFSGVYLPSADVDTWRVELTVTDLVLGGKFALDATTFIIDRKPGVTSITLSADLTVGQGAGALQLELSGDWSNSGDLSIDAALPDGETWSPFAGISFTDVSGSLERSGGTWSLGFTVGTEADLGPLGTATVTGTLDIQDGGKVVTGCLQGTVPDITVGGFGLSGLAVGACFDKNAAGDVEVTYTVAGGIVVGGDPLTFTGGYLPGAQPGEWALSMTVGDLALDDAVTLQGATFTVTKTGGATSVTVQGTTVLGKGDGALTLKLSGAWSNGGDFALTVSLPPGETWSPIADITFDGITGLFERKGGVWTISLSVSTTIELGPFGSAPVTGSLNVADNGEKITGCLTGSLPDVSSIGGTGIALTGLTGQVCFEDAPSGDVTLSFPFAGTIDMGSGGIGVDGVYSPLSAGEWSMSLTVTDLPLGTFTLDSATVTVEKIAGATTVTLDASMVLGDGADALALSVDGQWSKGGDLTLTVAQTGGSWEPVPGLVVSGLGGTFTRKSGVWAVNLGGNTSLDLGPLGQVNVKGELSVLDGGETVAGCLSSESPFSANVAGLTLTELDAYMCVTVSGGQVDVVPGFSGKVGLQGGTFDISGVYEAGPPWTITLTVSDMTLGGFSMDTATFTLKQGVGGGPATAALDAILILGNGANAVNLSVKGLWKGNGTFSLALAMLDGTSWSPFEGLNLNSANGTLKHDGGSWSIAVTVQTVVSLGPLGDITAQGDITLIKGADGWKASGCLAGDLTEALPVPGAAGDVSVSVCFGDTKSVEFALENWTPIPAWPELNFKNVGGTVTFGEDGWSLTLSAGPFEKSLGSKFLLHDINVTGTLDSEKNWSLGLDAQATFTFLSKEISLAFSGELDDDSLLTLTGTWAGSLKPLKPLGAAFDFVTLTNPSVSVAIGLDTGDVGVTLTAPFSFKLFGDNVSGTLSGGGVIGDDAGVWFTGEANPPSGGLNVPGMGKLTSSLCFAAANSEIADIALCGQEIDLQKGVRLMTVAPLPVKFTDDQSAGMLSVQVHDGSHVTIEAKLDTTWPLAKPGNGLPSIDYINVDSLALFADINGPQVTIGFSGVVDFKPTNQASSVAGIAEVSYSTTANSLGILLYLDGVWFDPFGLTGAAVENPGFAIEVALAGVPLPVAAGYNGDLYLKTSGSWPNKPSQGASNIIQLGSTLYFDTVPSKSGICVAGKCLPLPTIIVRYEVVNLTLAKLATLLSKAFSAAKSKVSKASDTPVLPPTSPEINVKPLDLEINEFRINFSTHNTQIFGKRFASGFRIKIDANAAGKSLLVDGAADTNGFSLEGIMDPISVLGVSLYGDPFANVLKPGSGGFKVGHDKKLNWSKGTIEAVVQVNKFGAGQFAHTLVKKEGSNKTGYWIGVGDPETLCDAGGKNCETYGRVSVRFRKGNQTRVMQTWAGVVPQGERAHVAVTLHPDSSGVTPAIYVNGSSKAFDNTGGSFAPTASTAYAVIGKGMTIIDEVRFWNAARSPLQLQGQSRILPPGSVVDSKLIARYTFDLDTGKTAYNSRYYATGNKMHGTYLSGAGKGADPIGQKLNIKLSARLDKPADSGLWLTAGVGLKIPVLAPNLDSRIRLQVGKGAAFAEAFAYDFTLLDIPKLGGILVGGYGPNGALGDWDDGVYAALDLGSAYIDASMKLGFKSAKGVEKVIGAGSFTVDGLSFEADGSLDLTVDIKVLGKMGIQGDFVFSTKAKLLKIVGKLILFGKTFAQGIISLEKAKLSLTATLNLPKILGIKLGYVDVNLSLDFANFQLCGSGTYKSKKGDPGDSGGFTCGVGVCIGGKGALDISLNCGKVKPCVTHSDCKGKKVCAYGLCAKAFKDWTPCSEDGVCKSGHCNGVCYEPKSRGKKKSCIANSSDHCKTGLTCINEKCLGKVSHGKSCIDPFQCPSGTTCRKVSVGKKCLYTNRKLGQTCKKNIECVTDKCGKDGGSQKCLCKKDSHCGSGQYCTNGNKCKNKKGLGVGCSHKSQCKSGFCSGLVGKCYKPNTKKIGQSCVKDDHCKAPHKCGTLNGKCKCTADSQCGSGKFCGNGKCKPLKSDGTLCTNKKQCQSNNCGGIPAKCYTPNSVVLGGKCVANPQCKSPHKCTAYKCKCNSNAQCGSGKFCGSGTCKWKKNDWASCSADKQCKSNNCSGPIGKCYTPNKIGIGSGCINNDHCAGPYKCGGGKCKCTKDSQCPGSKYCKSGTCHALKGDFKPCTANKQCQGGKCNQKCWTPKTRNAGTACVKNNHCKGSFNCSGGLCKCTKHNHCGGGKYCQSGKCYVKKAAGAWCNKNWQCKNGCKNSKSKCK